MSLEIKILKLNSINYASVLQKITNHKVNSLSPYIEIIKFKKSINIEYLFDFDDYEETPDSIDTIVDQLLELFIQLSKELSLTIKYSVQRSEYEDNIDCCFINGEDLIGSPEDIVREKKANEKFKKSEFSLLSPKMGNVTESIREVCKILNNDELFLNTFQLIDKLATGQSYSFNDIHYLDEDNPSYGYCTSINIQIGSYETVRHLQWEFRSDFKSEEMKLANIPPLYTITEGKNSRSFVRDNYLITYKIQDNPYSNKNLWFTFTITSEFKKVNYNMTLDEFKAFVLGISSKDEDQDLIEIFETDIKSYVERNPDVWEYRLALFYLKLELSYKFPDRAAFNLFHKLSENGNLKAQLICANSCYNVRIENREMYNKTEYYLTLASINGDESATSNLDRFKKHVYLDDIITLPLW